MSRIAALKHEMLDLERTEREELMVALMSSFDGTEELDLAWMEEIRSRYEAFRAGKIRAFEHDEVVSRFEARFG